MTMPTEEDVNKLKNEEADAFAKAQEAHNAFNEFLMQMDPTVRETLPAGHPEVIQYVEMRDKASAARVLYEQIRSSRASAEPYLRFQANMSRQASGSELVPLPEARMNMAKINYQNALMGEFEALSVLMVQGPEVLEQYDAALENLNKWREEYKNAKAAFEANPVAVMSPLSMQHEQLPEPVEADGSDSEE